MQFFTKARTLVAVLALTAPTAVLGVTTAAGTAQAATAVPYPQVCYPHAGTIMSSKAISIASAWKATSLTSNFLAGPGTITYTTTKTSTVGQQVSATFSLDEGLLFASVKEQYGIQLQRTHSQAGAWSYAKSVPAGQTDRLQQYHQSYEIGIKQTYMGYATGGICHVYTEISKTGNFFPAASRSNATFCWALTPYKTNRIEIGRTCRNL